MVTDVSRNSFDVLTFGIKLIIGFYKWSLFYI